MKTRMWLPALLLVPSLCAQSGAPDKFMEALRYEQFADRAFACQDGGEPVAAAIRWMTRALQSMNSFTAGTADRKLRAADAVTRMRQSLEGLRQWDRFLKKDAPRVERLLSDGHLSQAEHALPSNRGPECDPRLQRLLRAIAARRADFDGLMKTATPLCDQHLLSALPFLQAAAQIDQDDAGLHFKIGDGCQTSRQP